MKCLVIVALVTILLLKVPQFPHSLQLFIAKVTVASNLTLHLVFKYWMVNHSEREVNL
jgi:hypothetical protein